MKTYGGADYTMYHKTWMRATGGSWKPINEPKRYKATNAKMPMALYFSDHGVWLTRTIDVSNPGGWTKGETGTLEELWPVFIAHGRMVLSR